MYDTYSLVQQHRQQLQLQSPITPPEVSVVSKVKKWSSVDEALDGLSTMNKKDLVELFLHCEAPSISDLSFSDSGQEDWRYDGLLLDNGPILVSASEKLPQFIDPIFWLYRHGLSHRVLHILSCT